MTKLIREPGAPVVARKTDRKAKAAQIERDLREQSMEEFACLTDAAKERILNAAEEAAFEVSWKADKDGADWVDSYHCGVAVFTLMALAAEAAAAKAAGFESWAAFEAAQAQRLIGDVS